jgi:hypothetical protein
MHLHYPVSDAGRVPKGEQHCNLVQLVLRAWTTLPLAPQGPTRPLAPTTQALWSDAHNAKQNTSPHLPISNNAQSLPQKQLSKPAAGLQHPTTPRRRITLIASQLCTPRGRGVLEGKEQWNQVCTPSGVTPYYSILTIHDLPGLWHPVATDLLV